MSKKPTVKQEQAARRARDHAERQRLSMLAMDTLLHDVLKLIHASAPLPIRAGEVVWVDGKKTKGRRATLHDVYHWALYRELQEGRDDVADADEGPGSMADEYDNYRDAFLDDSDFDCTAEGEAFALGRELDPDYEEVPPISEDLKP